MHPMLSEVYHQSGSIRSWHYSARRASDERWVLVEDYATRELDFPRESVKLHCDGAS